MSKKQKDSPDTGFAYVIKDRGSGVDRFKIGSSKNPTVSNNEKLLVKVKVMKMTEAGDAAEQYCLTSLYPKMITYEDGWLYNPQKTTDETIVAGVRRAIREYLVR